MHVYRWDLDRTYLETEISSVRGLIRTAMQTAGEKRNVPGSAALLRALTDCDPRARVCVISGSPRQMRPVLEEKLALDGVRVDRLILKDNLGNIRRGRLRAVRGQVGFKLPILLEERVGLGPAVRETLFGDDSEADAVIYACYAAAVAGRIDEHEVARVLEAGDAYPDHVQQALAALRNVGRADAVEDIFIRVDRGVPLARYRTLGPLVVPVFSWLQAALVLWTRERVDAAGVLAVARACAAEASLDDTAVAGLFQDAARRELVTRGDLERLLEEAPELGPVRAATRAALTRLGAVQPPVRPPPATDLVGFLRARRADD